mmetsp:Transcript_13055/g.30101  ORF Transcript_13055/g.30101 Transcript_13055/m.30101 type:complete len:448 (-) Transcript_13055:1854-3197(-)
MARLLTASSKSGAQRMPSLKVSRSCPIPTGTDPTRISLGIDLENLFSDSGTNSRVSPRRGAAGTRTGDLFLAFSAPNGGGAGVIAGVIERLVSSASARLRALTMHSTSSDSTTKSSCVNGSALSSRHLVNCIAPRATLEGGVYIGAVSTLIAFMNPVSCAFLASAAARAAGRARGGGVGFGKKAVPPGVVRPASNGDLDGVNNEAGGENDTEFPRLPCFGLDGSSKLREGSICMNSAGLTPDSGLVAASSGAADEAVGASFAFASASSKAAESAMQTARSSASLFEPLPLSGRRVCTRPSPLCTTALASPLRRASTNSPSTYSTRHLLMSPSLSKNRAEGQPNTWVACLRASLYTARAPFGAASNSIADTWPTVESLLSARASFDCSDSTQRVAANVRRACSSPKSNLPRALLKSCTTPVVWPLPLTTGASNIVLVPSLSGSSASAS